MRIIPWLNRLGEAIPDTATNLVFVVFPSAYHVIGKYHGCLVLFVIALLLCAGCSAFLR
jgi:hypothetical protein